MNELIYSLIEELPSAMVSSKAGKYAPRNPHNCPTVVVAGPYFNESEVRTGGVSRPSQQPLEDRIQTSLQPSDLHTLLAREWHSNLDREFSEKGTDAYAWYSTFRKDPNNWGIFIPLSKLIMFASRMYQYSAAHCQVFDAAVRSGWPPAFDCLRVALRTLLAHEYTHFAMDYAIAQIELLALKDIYLPASRALRQPFGHKFEEEKLANASKLRAAKASTDVPFTAAYHAALLDLCRHQTGGYKDGEFAVADLRYFEQIKKCLGEYLSAAGMHPYHAEILHLDRLLPWNRLHLSAGTWCRNPFDWTRCPVTLILDLAVKNIDPNTLFASEVDYDQSNRRLAYWN